MSDFLPLHPAAEAPSAPGSTASVETMHDLVPARGKVGDSRTLVAVLAVIALGLGTACGVTWWSGTRHRDRTNAGIAALTARHLDHERRRNSYQAAMDAKLTAANLPGKLAAVTSADEAQTQFLTTAVMNTGADLSRLAQHEATCLAAVLAYDHAAGAFSDQARGSLPRHVDMTNVVPYCGADSWAA
jgi:hypothetical protein